MFGLPGYGINGIMEALRRRPGYNSFRARFEAAGELVTEEMIASKIVCGPDPAKHIEQIQKFSEAGFDHIYLHQVGPDQDGFFRFLRA